MGESRAVRVAKEKERVGGDSNTQQLRQSLAGCRTGPRAKGCREAKTCSDCRKPESEQGWEGRTSTSSQHVKNGQQGQTQLGQADSLVAAVCQLSGITGPVKTEKPPGKEGRELPDTLTCISIKALILSVQTATPTRPNALSP